MSVSIKKGDTVRVIAGKDKGAEGKVIQVLREEQRVIVEGVNRVKKHTKVVNQGGRAGTTGGIVTTEAPIHVSNVMVVSGKGTTRLGFKRVEDLLGEPLPPSALEYEQWWLGGRVKRGRIDANWQDQVQQRAWEGAGWTVEDLDLLLKNVTFRRL